MALHDIAQTDLNAIMLDTDTAWGRTFSIIDPDGIRGDDMVGRWSYIGEDIDIDTGVLVAGSRVAFAVSFEELNNYELAQPEHIEDEDSFPWIFIIAGVSYKVVKTMPDVSFQLITGILEIYEGPIPEPPLAGTAPPWTEAVEYTISPDGYTVDGVSSPTQTPAARTQPILSLTPTDPLTGVYFSFDAPTMGDFEGIGFAISNDIAPADLPTTPPTDFFFASASAQPGDDVIFFINDGTDSVGPATIEYTGGQLCLAIDPATDTVHLYAGTDPSAPPILSLASNVANIENLEQFATLQGVVSATIIAEPAVEYDGVTQWRVE